MLNILMIILCCTAQEIVELCSKMCLTDMGLFLHARKWSISDGHIGRADGIDELAVLTKSLDSVGYSLDSLTET